MIDECATHLEVSPAIEAAIEELRGLIIAREPSARFTVTRGFDPPGIYLNVIVDLPEADEINDAFMDRMIDMQVEEGLDVYVIPLESPEGLARREPPPFPYAAPPVISPEDLIW